MTLVTLTIILGKMKHIINLLADILNIVFFTINYIFKNLAELSGILFDLVCNLKD